MSSNHFPHAKSKITPGVVDIGLLIMASPVELADWAANSEATAILAVFDNLQDPELNWMRNELDSLRDRISDHVKLRSDAGKIFIWHESGHEPPDFVWKEEGNDA